MSSDRVLRLFIVAAVLAAAWYAGRDGVAMGIAVAIVGLAAAYWRAVLGIPVAVAMAAAAVYLPGVVAGATVVVVLLAITSGFVRMAFDLGPPPKSTTTPGDGQLYFGSDMGGIDGGS